MLDRAVGGGGRLARDQTAETERENEANCNGYRHSASCKELIHRSPDRGSGHLPVPYGFGSVTVIPVKLRNCATKQGVRASLLDSLDDYERWGNDRDCAYVFSRGVPARALELLACRGTGV